MREKLYIYEGDLTEIPKYRCVDPIFAILDNCIVDLGSCFYFNGHIYEFILPGDGVYGNTQAYETFLAYKERKMFHLQEYIRRYSRLPPTIMLKFFTH